MAEHPQFNSTGGFPRPLGPPCTTSGFGPKPPPHSLWKSLMDVSTEGEEGDLSLEQVTDRSSNNANLDKSIASGNRLQKRLPFRRRIGGLSDVRSLVFLSHREWHVPSSFRAFQDPISYLRHTVARLDEDLACSQGDCFPRKGFLCERNGLPLAKKKSTTNWYKRSWRFSLSLSFPLSCRRPPPKSFPRGI